MDELKQYTCGHCGSYYICDFCFNDYHERNQGKTKGGQRRDASLSSDDEYSDPEEELGQGEGGGDEDNAKKGD